MLKVVFAAVEVPVPFDEEVVAEAEAEFCVWLFVWLERHSLLISEIISDKYSISPISHRDKERRVWQRKVRVIKNFQLESREMDKY